MSKEVAEIKTKKELIARIKGVVATGEQRKKLVCVLIGHSNIVKTCFGYVYCSRCGDQVGDTLMGVFDGKNKVIVGHGCDVCAENYQKLTWKDKYLAHANPLSKEQQ